MPLLLQVLVLFSTFRAFSLDDKGNGVGVESCWQFEAWDVNVFHAEGALASLAVEMDMSVMMVAFSFFLADFVVEDASSVLEGVHHVVFEEEGEHSEDAGFVHGQHLVFQTAEALGVLLARQSLENENAVGCRFDSLSLQFADNILLLHFCFFSYVLIKKCTTLKLLAKV